jgi:hypothetical protein
MGTMREALREARRRGLDVNRVTLCGTINNEVQYSLAECSFELKVVTGSVLFITITLPGDVRQRLYTLDAGARVRISGQLAWARKADGSGRLLVKADSLDIL